MSTVYVERSPTSSPAFRASGGSPNDVRDAFPQRRRQQRDHAATQRTRGRGRRVRGQPQRSRTTLTSQVSKSRPRPRGGAPLVLKIDALADVSTPPTRGCSRVDGGAETDEHVDPAHAGVLRRVIRARILARGRPRPRGDAPPATARRTCRRGRPRPRGGAPWAATLHIELVSSTPPTRGCSVVGVDFADRRHVDPAHAGVLRFSGPSARCSASRSAHAGPPMSWFVPRIRRILVVRRAPLTAPGRLAALSTSTRGSSGSQRAVALC